MKKKRKSEKKGQDSRLENLLRFEIVVLLFGLIGFYYFLSFSPIRMPKKPIVSPQVTLAPLAPLSEPVVPVPESDASIAEESSLQVDKRLGSSASPVEADALAVSNPASETQLPETQLNEEVVVSLEPVVREAAVEVNSEDADDSLAEDSISRKELAPNEEPASQLVTSVVPVSVPPVESAQSDSLDPAEPISVSAKTLSSSTPAGSPVSVPSSPVTPEPASSPTVQTVVEVGSYVLQRDQLKFRTQLEELGFAVKTESVKRLTSMYRVFLGPYPNLKESRSMMAEARKLGDQPFLQKRDSGYVVVIGSFYLESSVIAWENMYHDAGFEPQVQKVSLMMPNTLLLLDGSQVNRDPQAVLAQIQASGFPEAHFVTNPSTNAK